MSTDIRAAQGAVEAFMSAGGQTTNVLPVIPDVKITERRLHMLREEVRELSDAYGWKDIVEVADAIADILVVALGAAAEAGIDIEPVLEEVIRSNETKIDWANAKPWRTHASGKIAKDHHYEPPQIESIINAQRMKAITS